MSDGPAGPALARALAVLAAGGTVVYPTETFYGIGARATSASAVAAVAALKGRDADKPIAVIVADDAMVGDVVAEVPAPAARLMARFWPGPLTLVLRARAGLPAPLTGGTGRIGVRVSSHATATALARGAGAPLTATSANPAGAPPAQTCAEAERYFGARVGGYVDGGALAGGVGSTVVVVEADHVRVVRAGAVPVAALRTVLGSTPIHA